jgi:uncharacterized membrane protein YbhN (UPF0104 family)
MEQRYKQEVVCTFVQLFLSVRMFSCYMHFCSIISICAWVFFLFVPLFNCFYLYVCFLLYALLFNCFYLCVCLYIQEENTRTDKNNWTKVHTRGKQMYRYKQLNKCTNKRNTHAHIKTIMHFCSIVSICACVFLLFVPLFNCFYLYVCFLLYALLLNCFYLCVCFPLVCTFIQLFLSAQIKTIEQMYKQEENTRTDKNNWTKVHTRGKHTHR